MSSSRELTTDELLDGKTQEDIDQEEAAKLPASNSTPQSLDEGLKIQRSLEVGGVIQDSHGNTWAVPAENVEDFDDLYDVDPYAGVVDTLRKDFDIVGVATIKMGDWLSRGYVPVYQDELKISKQMERFTGKATDSLHTVGDMTIMKIPKFLNEKRQASKHRETKRRLAAVEPTAAMVEKARKTGVMTSVTRKISQDVVDPGNRRVITADKEGNF